MQWSKLKKLVEERICDTLAGRIELHGTSYRDSYDVTGRYWIVVDGRRVFSAYTERGSGAYYEVADRSLDPASTARRNEGSSVVDIPDKQGVDALHDFHDALAAYLNLSIEEALLSPSPLIRALAVIDRRTGKRRLRTIEAEKDDHPLVRYLYVLRCASEGIDPGAAHQSTESE